MNETENLKDELIKAQSGLLYLYKMRIILLEEQIKQIEISERLRNSLSKHV